MNVLVIGGGGREHAMAWKIRQSPLVCRVFVAPGNAGTGSEPDMENVAIDVEDFPGLIEFARDNHIGLTIVGPEGPLVSGIVDAFQSHGLKCFGPSREAAQLEGSKTFTKEFLARHHIPTAEYQSFTDADEAKAYLNGQKFPVVIKADGLAAGKGVIIAQSAVEAEAAISDILQDNRFGEAGNKLVIEQFLTGEEASFICMVDGSNILCMATSQDHKAAYSGDTGPNTGGMGAYSPAPLVDTQMHEKIMDQVIRPTVDGLASEGIPYTGFLYAGLMIGEDQVPNVLEYNCRLGDPETQPIMMRLQSDLVAHCLAALDQTLGQQTAQWDTNACLGVVLAAQGYPGQYEKGNVITGLESSNTSNAKVFHAGTKHHGSDIVTSGGRVVCVTALGEDVAMAQQNAYQQVTKISWDGCWYRDDIGHRAVKS